MPQQLQINETIAQREAKTEVVRNVDIPASLPPAERVVSANASVNITEVEAGRGFIVIDGLIRASIYYASADDPSNVISIRRTFTFTDRITVSGVRPGYDINIESIIEDIDFYLINNRLIGLEFTVISDIEVTSPDVIRFIEEEPDLRLRRQEYRIQRQVRERNYSRELSAVERLSEGEPDLSRVINVDSNIRIIDIIADYDQVTVRGRVSNDIFYFTRTGEVEYTTTEFSFSERFAFRGVTPDMNPFVDTVITGEEASRIDNRRIRKTVSVDFRILVIQEEVVEIPIDIISPNIRPVTRTILVERIVAEERTRIRAQGQISIPSDNPAIARIIRASGVLQGPLNAEAQSGGVLLTGTINVNVIYVADLPAQPVYFAGGTINFSYFVDIPGVTSNMNAVVDAEIIRTNASQVGARQISIRSVVEINLLVTERVRVPVVIGIGDGIDEEAEPVTDGLTYTVRSGDTLYLIAQRFGVSIQSLIQANNITNPDQLQVGQEIIIP